MGQQPPRELFLTIFCVRSIPWRQAWLNAHKTSATHGHGEKEAKGKGTWASSEWGQLWQGSQGRGGTGGDVNNTSVLLTTAFLLNISHVAR